jgi:hypothetical protein
MTHRTHRAFDERIGRGQRRDGGRTGLEGEGGGRERVPAVEDAALGAHGERQREVPEVDLRPEVVRHYATATQERT